MTDKTFTVAGTSVKGGETKYRFANGTAAARTKVLEKDGHTMVLLFNLPSAMTAEAAKAWLQAQGTAVQEPTARQRTVTRLVDELVTANPSVNVEDRAKELHQLSWQYDTAWNDLEPEARATYLRYAEADAAA